ncbi:MAG: hypothetical protein HYS45_02425 [Parcubacteria group bacterium]|nr:hypothetical protein [Parcubacteria group bacterium]
MQNAKQYPVALRCAAVALIASFCNLLFVSCGADSPSGPKAQGVMMEESEESVVSALAGVPALMDSLAANPGTDRQFRVRDASGRVVSFGFGFHADQEGQFRPAFTKQNGERAFVRLGFEGLTLILRLTDASGNFLEVAGKQAAYPLPAAKPGQGIDPGQWMRNGIAVAGVALAAWLGLSAFQFIAAGLGTIAIAGLVIGGAVFVAGFVAEVLERLGWTMDDFRELFGGTLASLRDIIVGVVEQFRETYNV